MGKLVHLVLLAVPAQWVNLVHKVSWVHMVQKVLLVNLVSLVCLVKMVFLDILVSKVHLVIKVTMVHLKAHNDDIIGYSPDETRFEVEDSCHSGDKNGRVTIKFDTREVDILPIKDFRAFDFGDKQKRHGFSITEVCFHG